MVSRELGFMAESFPYVGPDGFAGLDVLEVKAQRASADEFAALYPAPALVFRIASSGPKDSDAWLRRTEDGDEATVRSDNTPAQPRAYTGRAAFLRKRGDVNPFAGMITVGRAINNDIVIALPSVSKFHGYFMQEAGAWVVVDHRSTNGTLVDDKRAEPNAKVKLSDGARLRLGKEVYVDFMVPRTLWAFLRSQKR